MGATTYRHHGPMAIAERGRTQRAKSAFSFLPHLRSPCVPVCSNSNSHSKVIHHKLCPLTPHLVKFWIHVQLDELGQGSSTPFFSFPLRKRREIGCGVLSALAFQDVFNGPIAWLGFIEWLYPHPPGLCPPPSKGVRPHLSF